MHELLRFLGLVLLAAAGVGLRRWAPQPALRINGWLPLALLALWGGVAIAGIFSGPEAPHRMAGHAALIAVWMGTALGAAIFVYGAVALGDGFCWLGAGAACLSLVAALITAVTGYTGPSRSATSAEHVLRFEILHLAILPLLTAALFVGWAWLARADRKENGAPS